MTAWGRLLGYVRRPLPLLTLVGCFALSGYAVSFLSGQPHLVRIVAFFVLVVVGHDLILFPLYSLADRGIRAGTERRPTRPPAVPVINYVRIPVMASGLLLLVFLPTITRHGQALYGAQSGLSQSPYLARWLALTGLFFLSSAVVYAWRVGRVRRRRSALGRDVTARNDG